MYCLSILKNCFCFFWLILLLVFGLNSCTSHRLKPIPSLPIYITKNNNEQCAFLSNENLVVKKCNRTNNKNPASRAFFSPPRSWRNRERVCVNRVRSSLRMLSMALRNNYKLRPNSRALGLAGSVMTIVLSINGCSHPQGSI